jgi:hypothetical protein
MVVNMEKITLKPFVFVLMPFAKEFDDIYTYGIKPACKEAGAYCERVDEQIFEESILERIYNQILKSDLIVSDMTGRNPNVFYETGYAHALGKQVILLTQNVEDIPFDLKHYPHIVYGGKISMLKDDLKRRVKWCLDSPKRSFSEIGSDLEFYLKGEKLVAGMTTFLQIATTSSGTRSLKFAIDVHNVRNKICDASFIELGLILPLAFENASSTSTIRLPNKLCLHLLEKLGRFLPDGWKSVTLDIQVKSFEAYPEQTYNCVLRVFSELGVSDTPFKLQLI